MVTPSSRYPKPASVEVWPKPSSPEMPWKVPFSSNVMPAMRRSLTDVEPVAWVMTMSQTCSFCAWRTKETVTLCVFDWRS